MSAAAVSATASVGLLLVAAITAIIALRQLKQARSLRAADVDAARQLREEEAAPYIVVDIAPGRPTRKLLYLSITNTGKTLARDVEVRFEPELRQAMNTAGYDIRTWAPLQNGIKTLSPGGEVAALFDESVKLHHADLPRVYSVSVDYKDGQGRRQPTLQYEVDLTHLFGALYVEELTVHDLAQTVSKIEETLGRYRTEGLPVRTYAGE